MDLAFLLLLQVICQPALVATLFTVEAEQSSYESEFGGEVVLGCIFKTKLPSPPANLKVTWQRITAAPSGQHVYWMENGKEHLDSQDPGYRGRVKLLTEDLKNGLAKLQISRLRINDSGVFQCLVQTPEGADYKEINLSVKAPYKDVVKHIQKSAEGDGVLLTCQSEGYPESSVVWQDGHMQRLKANTTAVSTLEQLFKVTSQIHVRSSDKNNYTCSFAKDGPSAAFQIPDEVTAPHDKNEALIIILCMAVMMAVIAVAVLMYRRKGCRNTGTRTFLANGGGRDVLPALFLRIDEDNEEEKTSINDKGSTKENVEAFAKAHYLHLPFSRQPRQYWEAFGGEVLSHRLQNNEGQPVNLQALLPEAGETLLLQGPPESGRTTLAKILVSSWAEGPEHAFPNLLDLSAVRLLLYVDCSKAKGDLFEEITTQLSLSAKISADELRDTVLTLSSEALLLLDGYKEGGEVFDESVRKFLSEQEGCRVLVMACMGHCDSLKDTAGTGRMVRLQTESVTH